MRAKNVGGYLVAIQMQDGQYRSITNGLRNLLECQLVATVRFQPRRRQPRRQLSDPGLSNAAP